MMFHRIALFTFIFALLLSVEGVYSYNVPYYFSGSSDLEASATSGTQSYIDNVIDEDTGFTGWSSGSLETTTQSLFIEFKSGVAAIDKIQILSGADPDYFRYHAKEFALYYTTDTSVDKNSNWLEVTNLSMINSEPEIVVTDNHVLIDSGETYVTDEFLLSFDVVDATAIRFQAIQDYTDPMGNHVGVRIREVTIDGTESAPAVPEPASLILISLGIIGLIRKRK